MIDPSPLESARFGLRIGRWVPADVDEQVETADFDVVIVRRPAEWADRWADLARHDGYTALHADTLVFWEWRDDGGDLGPAPQTASDDDTHRLDELVRDVFERYQNHYASNPLLDPDAALEGYVEWATRTVATSGGALILTDDLGPTGFALVDWTADPPDVRLAGVCQRARRRGEYGKFMLATMWSARDRGSARLQISTQVQNVGVQRTWSRLGWRPFAAFDTVHLVRADLLSVERPSTVVPGAAPRQ